MKRRVRARDKLYHNPRDPRVTNGQVQMPKGNKKRQYLPKEIEDQPIIKPKKKEKCDCLCMCARLVSMCSGDCHTC